jgi:hypothetical protein
MTRYEYIKLNLSYMPEDVIAHYHLLNNATPDGYVYFELLQSMYGLLQAEIIAQELSTKRLKEHSYSQGKTTPGLWTREWCPITFSLVLQDKISYSGEEHAQHLI